MTEPRSTRPEVLQKVLVLPERIEHQQATEWGNVELTLVLSDETYEIEDFRLTRDKGGPPISSVMLRQVPLQQLANEAIEANVRTKDRLPLSDLWPSAEAVWELKKDGPTPELLDWVYLIHALASVTGQTPAKTVQERLDIPASTASLWIRRAKDRQAGRTSSAGTRWNKHGSLLESVSSFATVERAKDADGRNAVLVILPKTGSEH